MRPISDIVTSRTTFEVSSIQRANFSVILLVDEQDPTGAIGLAFGGYRTKEFGSIDEISDIGYVSGSYVYDAANKIFSQNPSVDKIIVGLKYITVSADANWTAALNAIRNETRSFYGISIGSMTLAVQKEVADWVEARTDPNHLFFIRTDDVDVKETPVPTAGYQTISNTGALGAFTGATVPAIPSNTYDLDVTIDNGVLRQLAVALLNTDDWDGICIKIEAAIDALETGTTCEIALEKIKITSPTTGEGSTVLVAAGTAGSAGGDLIAAITALGADYTAIVDAAVVGKEDIAYYVYSLSYSRCAVYYSDNAATNYIECAAMGERFPKAASLGTWAGKTLVGVATDSFSTAERNIALAKNCNIYVTRAGVFMVDFGTMGNGYFIDEVRGIDQIDAWIAEDIFQLATSVEKIPGNNTGISMVVGQVNKSLNTASENIINDDFEITYPDQLERLAGDILARHLAGVKWNATLQGAIHTIAIEGTVTR